jgi:hypothetical protein
VTDERSADISRSEPEIAASVRWPDEAGPWLVTAHWAKVDGRAVIVGLDVRSYVDHPTGADGSVMREPVSDQLAEVTQRVVRGLLISKIRDLTRADLIGRSESVLFSSDPEIVADHGDWAADRLDMLTAKGEPRKRRRPATEDLLRHVAALYTEAVGQGDTMPAKYVENRLRAAGELLPPLSSRVLVRQWIRRARQRKYLTIRPPRSEGA